MYLENNTIYILDYYLYFYFYFWFTKEETYILPWVKNLRIQPPEQ